MGDNFCEWFISNFVVCLVSKNWKVKLKWENWEIEKNEKKKNEILTWHINGH